MKTQTLLRSICLAGSLVGMTAAWGQVVPPAPHHDTGDSITGVFEGWFRNSEGTFIEIGYYNRNLKQEVDIPVGANNKIEPGGPDFGQPTHFYPGKAWGVQTIKVPDDFADKQLTWTITANGKSTTIPLNLKTDWELSPFVDAGGDLPPYMSFAPFKTKARTLMGPIPVETHLATSVGEGLALTVYVADDALVQPDEREMKVPVTLHWTVFRAAPNGSAKFTNSRPVVEKTEDEMPPKAVFTGKATTTVTFSEPGEYVLEVVANDATGEGGGGFMCCWTNGLVKVTVSGPAQHTTGGF